VHAESLKPIINWLIHTAPEDAEAQAALMRAVGEAAVRRGGEKDGTGAGGTARGASTDFSSFQRRVEEVVTKQIGKIAGRIRVMSLATIKEVLGDRWERSSAMVLTNAEAVLQKHLLPGDAYTRYRDDAFLILFSALDGPAAEQKVRQILSEVHDRLLGRLAGDSEFLVNREAALDASGHRGDDIVAVSEVAAALDTRIERARLGDSTYSTPWGDVELTYRPTRALKSTSHSLLFAGWLKRWTEKRRELVGEATYPRNAEGILTFELDYFAATTALRHLRKAVETDKPYRLILPFHFHSLADKNRGVLLRLLKDVPKRVRKYVTVEVVAVPEGTPVSRFTDVVGNLKSHVDTLFLRVPLGTTRAGLALAERSVDALGVDLSGPPGKEGSGGPVSEKLLAASVAAFARPVVGHGMASYCFGVESKRVLDAAMEAGIDYVNGPAVAAETKAPWDGLAPEGAAKPGDARTPAHPATG